MDIQALVVIVVLVDIQALVDIQDGVGIVDIADIQDGVGIVDQVLVATRAPAGGRAKILLSAGIVDSVDILESVI